MGKVLLDTLQLNVVGWPAATVEGLAVKLVMVGAAPVGTFAGVKIVPVCTTSKSEAVICFRRFRSVLFQRLSGAPLMKIALPLSARINPYFFMAVRITWSSAGHPEISTEALRRRRSPLR